MVLFGIGGGVYIVAELLYRQRSHWTMFLLGGLCFLYAGIQNEGEKWETPLPWQSLKVALFITAAEFATGCIVNRWLGWAVWDYSDLPFNLFGQVCLPFTLVWLLLGTVAIILDDYLRYWLFKEEKPRYKLTRKGRWYPAID